MKYLRLFLCALIPLIALWKLASAEVGPLELYYTSAASFETDHTSTAAIPIGNGKMAAMIYGGVSTEIIQFNEDTVWAGAPNDYSNPGASDVLQDIRNLVWEGRGEDAYNQYAKNNFMSVPLRQSPYVATAELRISTGHGSVSNYRRSLDLETATAHVSYDIGGVTHTRETFASYPDKVIVVRFSASEPGSVNVSVGYNTPHTQKTVTAMGNQLLLDAKVNRDADTRRQQVSDIEFQARVEVRADGGSVTPQSSSISVQNADSVTLVLHVATNFVRFNDLSADPDALAAAALAAVETKDFDTLRSAHIADYQELFNRVVLDLGTTAKADLPTNQRLSSLKAEVDQVKDEQKYSDIPGWTSGFTFNDPQLVTLNFQMARYLMISGSRPGSQPLNLQGKWNNELNPSWESKMTLNINQEMNYWAAEVTNLGESHVPMVDLVRDLTISGATVASTHYNASGWMVHHNTDLWRGAAPINNPGGLWPSGGAWLSMHLWWHYLYSGDMEVLEEIYPLMKGAAEFFVDFLIMDPRSPSDQYPAWGNSGRPQWGQYLLTNPSHSPEQPNKFLDDNGELVAGTMMDNQLIRALFGYVIEASEILGVDESFRATLEAKRALLPPNMIGKHGQLQEWLEDVDVPENPVIGGHRHISHLVDVFPGEGIHPIYEPEFADAAKVVLDWKGDPSNNTSWSRAWKMNLRAALGEADHAFMILQDIIGRSHTENMTFSNKSNGRENQIDGNFGALMGTAQFFLQSRRGEIHLLPALPTKLSAGSVTGLRAQGAFEVDIEWSENSLDEAVIHSLAGNPCVIRTASPVYVLDSISGLPVPVEPVDENLYGFLTTAGQSYVVIPADSLPTWAGYPIVTGGYVDTGSFVGWLYVDQAPFVYSVSLANWMYMPEELVTVDGAWTYIFN
ncbi:MAG: glycoside hydrolase N-terminal domain-containing protein [Puniceicoccaceae bacterium]